MARPLVRNITGIVVKFLHFAKIRRNILVTEAALLGALGLRRRARRIFVGVERKPHVADLRLEYKQSVHLTPSALRLGLGLGIWDLGFN